MDQQVAREGMGLNIGLTALDAVLYTAGTLESGTIPVALADPARGQAPVGRRSVHGHAGADNA